MENPEITFRSSSLKLRQGFGDKATLSWNVRGAVSITMDIPRVGRLSLSDHGKYVVQPNVTTQYKLIAKFPDGTKQIKHLEIEVLPVSEASFDVVEINDGNGVHAELRWNIIYASNIKIDNIESQSSGFKKYLITGKKKIVISYEDAFGKHSKVFHVQKNNGISEYITDMYHLTCQYLFLWIINIIYFIFKICTRLFVPWGKVGKIEYKITTITCLIAFIYVVGNCIIPNFNDLGNRHLYSSHLFMNSYVYISILSYILIMLLNKSDLPDFIGWIAETAFIVYPLLPYVLPINDNWGFYCVSFFIYGFFAILLFFGLPFDNEESSGYYFKSEFFTNRKINYKRRPVKKIKVW